MKLYLTGPRSNIKVVAEYAMASKAFVVLKSSIICEMIACSEKFRGEKHIEKSCAGVADGTRKPMDVPFKNTFTTVNLVTGASKHGLISWKDGNRKTLKEKFAEMEGDNE